MTLKLLVVGLLQLVAAHTLPVLQDLDVVDDNAAVGSYLRPVRAAYPENYHKSYENEGDGEVGYSRKKSGGGKKGYQHFDSFHKKAGDNFEFEKQDSYGLDDEDHDGAHSHQHEKKAPRHHDVEEREEVEEERPRKKEKSDYPHDHEALKEGANDGNGGVEAYGHDPADYVLPEKYTYGAGDEYNF